MEYLQHENADLLLFLLELLEDGQEAHGDGGDQGKGGPGLRYQPQGKQDLIFRIYYKPGVSCVFRDGSEFCPTRINSSRTRILAVRI